jgi:HEAT repeat protein
MNHFTRIHYLKITIEKIVLVSLMASVMTKRYKRSERISMSKENIQNLILDLGSRSISARKNSLTKLVELGKAVVPSLINSIAVWRKFNPQIRAGIAEALGLIGDSRPVEALVRSIAQPAKCPRIIVYPEDMPVNDHPFGRIKNRDELVPVKKPGCFEVVDDPIVRDAAAIALIRIGKSASSVFSRLLKHLGKELWETEIVDFRQTWTQAMRKLVDTKDTRAIPVLIEDLKNADQNIRINAAWGLEKFRDFSKASKIVPSLIAMLNGTPPNERNVSERFIGSIRRKYQRRSVYVASTDPLLNLINLGSTSKERYIAADILGEIGRRYRKWASRMEPELIKALADKESIVQIRVVRALGKIRSRKALAKLRKLAKSAKEPKLREEAKAAIRKITMHKIPVRGSRKSEIEKRLRREFFKNMKIIEDTSKGK